MLIKHEKGRMHKIICTDSEMLSLFQIVSLGMEHRTDIREKKLAIRNAYNTTRTVIACGEDFMDRAEVALGIKKKRRGKRYKIRAYPRGSKTDRPDKS